MKNYQEKYRVPIYIGEFSSIRWAPNNSTFNYLRDCIELFEEYNWDWNFHAFREWDGWSVEHSTGFYDPILPTTMTDRESLLRDYFQQNLGQTTFQKNQSAVCFPNPANNEIFISTDKLDFNRGIVEIFDFQGKIITQKQVIAKDVVKIDTSNFSEGFYFYVIKNEAGKMIVNGKFIINK